MFRIKIAVLVVGVMMGYFGVQEMRVSSSATIDPVEVKLADVESGQVSDNNHWRLGEHIAVYGGSIYECRQGRFDHGEPGDDVKCTCCYYPVMSYGHAYVTKLAELEATYGDLSQAPNDEFPRLDTFSVLVKTRRFKTLGDIPDGLSGEDAVQGLVVNRIEGLDSEEKDLLRDSFPGLDVDNLLLLEDARKPSSAMKSTGLIAGGAALSLLGVAWLFRNDGSA